MSQRCTFCIIEPLPTQFLFFLLTQLFLQVNGEVYAVDEYTMLIKDFVYDGNGKDTFFWAGGSNRPGTQGFIVPNEAGRTNVLERYLNDEITITLPDRKRLTEIKWFAVYDLTLHDPFGDIYIPEDFEPPGNS